MSEAKKRRCVLCDDGLLVTRAPKDKAVCMACARELMPESPCPHHLCDCPCHGPGGKDILHIEACCGGSCDLCGSPITNGKLLDHYKTCHAALFDLLCGEG